MEELKINLQMVEDVLVNFVKDEVTKSGFKKVVLGLSGGIDSAIVAYIAAKALGPENVMGIMMPYKASSKESVDHAELVIKDLGIKSKLIEITPMLDAYFALDPEISDMRKGNKMARERMTI
ncbi:MAG: NAD(+) synthase, partial [Fusobacteriaceae bacterium]